MKISRISDYTRAKKILVLSIIFFFSGLAFFYFRMNSSDTLVAGNNMVLKSTEEKKDYMQILKNMPDPKEFESLTFNGQESINIKMECKKEYAVALIYPSSIDYRFDPSSSKYNTAFPCNENGSKKFSLYLKGANLEIGSKYYIIKAHQSKTGSWSDPY